jgi:hypothetical protein
MSSPRSSTTSAPTLTHCHGHDIERKAPQSLTLCNDSSTIDDLSTARKTRCETIVSRLAQFKRSVMY